MRRSAGKSTGQSCVATFDCGLIYFFIYLFILFLFAIIITINIRKEEKKKRRGDLTETIEAYERLGLLELRARAVSHQLKKR